MRDRTEDAAKCLSLDDNGDNGVDRHNRLEQAHLTNQTFLRPRKIV